jgi:hypothetical protein
VAHGIRRGRGAAGQRHADDRGARWHPADIRGRAGVGIALSVKRHVSFYRDESKRDRLLEIKQDKKFQPIMATYTVRDARGARSRDSGRTSCSI